MSTFYPKCRERRLATTAAICLLAMLPSTVHADAESDALISEIIELSGTRARIETAAIITTRNEIFGSAAAQAMPQAALEIVTNEIIAVVRETFSDPALWAGARRAYEGRFSHDELRALRDFYATATALKLRDARPAIDAATLAHMRPIFASLDAGPEIMRRSVPRLLEAGLITETQAELMLSGASD